mgnify:CR=1 FL=1
MVIGCRLFIPFHTDRLLSFNMRPLPKKMRAGLPFPFFVENSVPGFRLDFPQHAAGYYIFLQLKGLAEQIRICILWI